MINDTKYIMMCESYEDLKDTLNLCLAMEFINEPVLENGIELLNLMLNDIQKVLDNLDHYDYQKCNKLYQCCRQSCRMVRMLVLNDYTKVVK